VKPAVDNKGVTAPAAGELTDDLPDNATLHEDGAVAVRPVCDQRRYYGWTMLPVAMLGFIATTPGQTFGVSIFNESMRLSLGLSHGELAAAYTLGTLGASIPLAYVGGLIDRHGLRKTMTAVIALFGLACFAVSAAGGWFTLFAAFLILRLLGPGALGLSSSNTLANWFHRRLGLVEGIRHVGMAVSMAVVPVVNLWLLNQFGWRGSYTVFGLAVWAGMLPLMLFIYRERPEDVGQVMDGARSTGESGESVSAAKRDPGISLRQAVRTRAFWIVCAGNSTFGIIHTAVFFCIVPIFLDKGLTAAHAAQMLTIFAVSLAMMQFFGGMLADRIPADRLLPAPLAGLAVSMLLLMQLDSPAAALMCGAVMGVSQGLFFAATNPLWARYFGRLHLGRIRGTVATINVGSSSLGPLLFGVCRDILGSYDAILIAAALLPIPLVVLSRFATPPGETSQPEAEEIGT